MRFKLIPVEEKPKIRRRKRSRYDPIIESFVNSGYEVAKVEVEGVSTKNLYLVLRRRLKSLGIDYVKVETINGEVYLERI